MKAKTQTKTKTARIGGKKESSYDMQGPAPEFVCEQPAVYGVETQPLMNFKVVRQSLGATQQDMQALAGISVRKMSALETGEQLPTRDDLRRLNELTRLQTQLARVMEPASVGRWLKTPNSYFGGASPAYVISNGEMDRVWRLVWRLLDGVPLT